MLIAAVQESLCLAYANTLSWRGSEAPVEDLHTLADLLRFLERAEAVSAASVADIADWARQHEKWAQTLFDEAIAVREATFRAFSAIANGAAVRDQHFATIKSALATAPARTQLARAHGGYAWRIEQAPPSMPHLLAPVLWSAADLMLNAPHRRIRECANEKCLWLFLDESKSGTRRWCDMSACGNRAKAQRHYLKHKQS